MYSSVKFRWPCLTWPHYVCKCCAFTVNALSLFEMMDCAFPGRLCFWGPASDAGARCPWNSGSTSTNPVIVGSRLMQTVPELQQKASTRAVCESYATSVALCRSQKSLRIELRFQVPRPNQRRQTAAKSVQFLRVRRRQTRLHVWIKSDACLFISHENARLGPWACSFLRLRVVFTKPEQKWKANRKESSPAARSQSCVVHNGFGGINTPVCGRMEGELINALTWMHANVICFYRNKPVMVFVLLCL